MGNWRLQMILRCLPRRVNALTAYELRVSKTFSDNPAKRLSKPTCIVVFAFVETKRLFIQIPEQMKRLDIHVRSVQGALEKRPEVFKAVRMDVALCVANGMVNNSPVVIFFKIIIGHESIGADGRALLNVCAHVPTKLRPARVIDYLKDYAGKLVICSAFQNALHGGFLESGMANACALVFVHVARLRAYIRFICFNVARELCSKSLLHRKTNALQHEPSGLLSDTKTTVKLIRANPVLAVSSQPHCRKPFIQTDRRILEDRSDLYRKLLFRMRVFALPQFRLF